MTDNIYSIYYPEAIREEIFARLPSETRADPLKMDIIRGHLISAVFHFELEMGVRTSEASRTHLEDRSAHVQAINTVARLVNHYRDSLTSPSFEFTPGHTERMEAESIEAAIALPLEAADHADFKAVHIPFDPECSDAEIDAAIKVLGRVLNAESNWMRAAQSWHENCPKGREKPEQKRLIEYLCRIWCGALGIQLHEMEISDASGSPAMNFIEPAVRPALEAGYKEYDVDYGRAIESVARDLIRAAKLKRN